MAIFNSKLLVYQRIYLHIFTVINRFNPTRSQFTWHPRRCEDACIYGGTMVSTWQPYKAGMVICACQIWTGKWEWHAHRIEISSMHAFGKVSRLKGDAAAWTQVSVLVPFEFLRRSWTVIRHHGKRCGGCAELPGPKQRISRGHCCLLLFELPINPQASSVLQTWAASWSEGPGDPEEEAPAFRCQKTRHRFVAFCRCSAQ